MELTEKTIDSREIFKGRIIRVRLDTVRLPNGKEGIREVVEHPGGVAILAIDSEERVLLVRQYRYPFERVMTEVPAGKREPGEPPFITAQRELQEEVGATADTWTELGTLIPSPGCYGETLYLYMAQDLHFGATHPDEDEFLEPLRVPLDEAVRQCMDGTLTDAKTVAAILKGKILREQ
ncbi:NUDIX domain-containing protein [Dysosmobacter sp.]|jgi:ADP-ribose pyrophosphatase|uniref:NUDIX domain-containing protein n=1 Tax=Dysosmobacter sp. TaxID=2591382 RepID=UPI003AEF5557